MTTPPLGSLIWPATLQPDGLHRDLARMKRQIAALQARQVNVATLAELSPNLGNVSPDSIQKAMSSTHNGRMLLINKSTKTAIYSRTIQGNAMRESGFIDLCAPWEWYNNTGSNRTFTLDIDFGSTSIVSVTSPAIGSSGSNRVGSLRVRLYNDGAATFQQVIAQWDVSDPVASGTLTTRGSHHDVIVFDTTSAEDASNDLLFEVSLTLSTASNDFFCEIGGMAVVGPTAIEGTGVL